MNSEAVVFYILDLDLLGGCMQAVR